MPNVSVTARPSGLVTIDEIRDAARGLDGVAERTPLLPAEPLRRLAGGAPVYLKLENRQPTGAFKLRGAWTAVRRLSEAAQRAGVITYSSGNHGQAVAFAARRLGVRAVIVMPENTPEAKVRGVRRWGGEVVFAGTTSEDRKARAEEIVREQHLHVIPPFDHPDIIAGQGTVGLEIAEVVPDVRHVAVPVGGGGLLAGVTTALAALAPAASVVGVEPEGAPTLREALAHDGPVRLAGTRSIADGLLPLSVGTLTFAHVRGRVRAVTVPDRAIAEAVVFMRDTLGLLVEPSGAATTAALRSGAFTPSGPTVLVVSGGNMDPGRIDALLAEAG
jgi:threonine dehydratase